MVALVGLPSGRLGRKSATAHQQGASKKSRQLLLPNREYWFCMTDLRTLCEKCRSHAKVLLVRLGGGAAE
jgi:hypothetical protein